MGVIWFRNTVSTILVCSVQRSRTRATSFASEPDGMRLGAELRGGAEGTETQGEIVRGVAKPGAASRQKGWWAGASEGRACSRHG